MSTAAERGWTWFCVSCGIERGPDPSKVCPRPGCGMRAYGSRPPAEPVLPAAEATVKPDGTEW